MVLRHVGWYGVSMGLIFCFGGLLETADLNLSSCSNRSEVLMELMIREARASIDIRLICQFFGIGFGGHLGFGSWWRCV